MRFLRFLDKKLTARVQKNIVTSYLFFGAPAGIIFTQILKIISSGWSKYQFNLPNIISVIFFDILIMSPLIINYFRHRKKYKNVIRHIIEQKDKKHQVKALFNFDDFIKGQLYIIDTDFFMLNFGTSKISVLFIKDNQGLRNTLKDIINKFELEDIKEERLRKLKKLKRLW